MSRPNWLIIFVIAPMLALSACAPAATPQLVPTSTPVPSLAVQAQPGQEKISSRLQTLQANPTLLGGSADDLSKALSLPPGSLQVDAGERILANVRVKDASDFAVQAIKASGAVIVHVSAQYNVVTVFIALADLQKLAALPNVLGIQEELAPQVQGAGG